MNIIYEYCSSNFLKSFLENKISYLFFIEHFHKKIPNELIDFNWKVTATDYLIVQSCKTGIRYVTYRDKYNFFEIQEQVCLKIKKELREYILDLEKQYNDILNIYFIEDIVGLITNYLLKAVPSTRSLRSAHSVRIDRYHKT